MERATTTTRLRFKGEGRSSSRRSDREPHAQSRSPSRFKERSRSPSDSSKKKRRRGSRSRSPPSDSRSGRRDRRDKSKPRHKITPAGFAPASLSGYDYLFDPDDYSIHSPEAIYLREQERERQRDEAYALELEQQEEQQKDPWLRHLFDELANDDSLDYHSSLFESHALSSSSHHHSHTSQVKALSDSDYASYMRRGMRRSRAEKEAQEWKSWVQEQERIRYQQAKEDQRQKDERSRQRRQERKERERLEREANRNKGEYDDTPSNQLRKRKLVEEARRVYEHGWQVLTLEQRQKDNAIGADIHGGASPLSIDMVPWPPLGATSESTTLPSSASPSASSTTDAGASTSELSLFDFLFHGTTADQLDVRKRLLRREQLRFHPDKFKQRFGDRMPTESTERERILAMVERVARAFNEVGEALQSASL